MRGCQRWVKDRRSDLPRKARKRGGKSDKHGLSAEQIPVIVARDRQGATTDAVLAILDRASIASALDGVVTPANEFCCDGGTAIVAFARHAGIAAHVLPKLFLSHGSYEYWGRCASLIHTTADSKADVAPSPNTRIYFFSGSQHGAGSIPPAKVLAQNRANTNDYRFALRALLLAMDRWIKTDAAPPPSHFPHLARNELTTLVGLHFPKVPGVELPLHKREAYRLDFSIEPPQMGAVFPTLVPQVDADGNDLGGIQMPEIKVPLASYTGWNRRAAAIGGPTRSNR